MMEKVLQARHLLLPGLMGIETKCPPLVFDLQPDNDGLNFFVWKSGPDLGDADKRVRLLTAAEINNGSYGRLFVRRVSAAIREFQPDVEPLDVTQAILFLIPELTELEKQYAPAVFDLRKTYGEEVIRLVAWPNQSCATAREKPMECVLLTKAECAAGGYASMFKKRLSDAAEKFAEWLNR